eukprot:comp17546_c0_seq4/m.29849 comp17546_c0_seq4/g.29849  ORF comp17546_c0_seq4/g.29849 comp17546_c0_seq4/m.29849 type:complete len:441 (-) comp17546_c0_seq4:24-1346(-)
MSSRYQSTLTIPDGFQVMLKDFAREVLRHQPVNIFEYGARYFSKLASGRKTPTLVDCRAMSAVELKEYLLNLFLDHDPKHSGHVDYKTFARLLTNTAKLQMKTKEHIAVMSEADENAKGQIQYKGFVEDVSRILYRLYRTEGQKLDEDTDPSTVLFVHGYLERELLDELKTGLAPYDPDRTGKVARADLRKFLRECTVGFSRKEINVMLAELNEDIHAKFEIPKFVESSFGLLVLTGIHEATLKQKIPKAWEAHFLDLFKAADTRMLGSLHHTQLRLILRDSDFALSDLQIYAVMSEADEDVNGNVDYAPLATVLGNIFNALFSIPLASKRNAALKTIALRKADTFVHGMERDVFSGRLRAALSEHDKTGSGIMNRFDVRNCLETSGLELNHKEVNALMSTLDEDKNGRVDYLNLLPLAYNVMVHVARLELIMEITREKK